MCVIFRKGTEDGSVIFLRNIWRFETERSNERGDRRPTHATGGRPSPLTQSPMNQRLSNCGARCGPTVAGANFDGAQSAIPSLDGKRSKYIYIYIVCVDRALDMSHSNI
jgi:hypothetical protein